MNVIDAMMTRSTIRAFKPHPIGQDILGNIMDAALRTPSWANTQPWEIFIATGDPLERIRSAYAGKLNDCAPREPDVAMPKEWPVDLKQRMDLLRVERMAALEQACGDSAVLKDMLEMNYRLFDAPVILYVCMDRSLSPWSLFDLGAFCQSTMLAALEHGIGSAVAVVLAAHPDVIRKELGIPDHLSIVIGIALGYADDSHPQNVYRTKRRCVKEAVRFKGFS